MKLNLIMCNFRFVGMLVIRYGLWHAVPFGGVELQEWENDETVDVSIF